jgi:hypothetical protein
MPEKAADGLKQLGVDVVGKTLDELFASPPKAGAKLGDAHALFPSMDQK